MVHTTHSYASLRRMTLFSPERIANYRLGKDVETFIDEGRGYHYVAYRSEESEYGLAVLSKEYVLSLWPQVSGLKIVEYIEGAIEAFPEGCQDLVVLAKGKGESV